VLGVAYPVGRARFWHKTSFRRAFTVLTGKLAFVLGGERGGGFVGEGDVLSVEFFYFS